MTREAEPRRSRRLRRFLGWGLLLGAAWGGAAYGGLTLGHQLMRDQPSTRDLLQHHAFNLSSKVLAANGEVIYTFAEEKRDYVRYADISPWLVQGLVATEDAQFWTHRGLNLQGISRAAVANLSASLDAGRVVVKEGGSSITQQLAKQLFLTPERSFERKAKEAVLALHVEKSFRKEEILEMYLNHVFLGHQRHGVEAAARYYFGKGAKELALPEAALLAGIPQRPSAYSPRSNPAAAVARRDHVLARMHAVGYITREQHDEARATPLVLASTETQRRLQTQQAAPYFVEEVRRLLVERHGDLVNTGGLTVETTLDPRLQREATRAVREGLRRLDKQLHGWRPVAVNLVDAGLDPEAYEHPLWLIPPEVDGVAPGIVLEVEPSRALVRVGESRVEMGPSAAAWTGRGDLTRLLRRGDLAPFRLLPEPGAAPEAPAGTPGTLRGLELEQDPELEASLVAIDVPTGEVVAMVGGYDYARSEFNKVTQAQRQAGSAFKPFCYAAALEAGLPPSLTVMDEPSVFVDPWTGAEYAPENYYKDYHGRVTLRTALEKSLNIASVRLLNLAGYDRAIGVAKAAGITAALAPYPSLALGSMEITLLELTSAYSVFPNMGVRVEPRLVRRVRDAKGDVIGEPSPGTAEVLSPETSFQICHLLRGVVHSGTAQQAKSLGRPVAGKTGTTDDYSNAWFVGFTPSLVAGVWVGYEKDLRPIGKGMSGGVAALPLWIDFMAAALEGAPPDPFVNPGGIEFVAIDRTTGLRASLECPREAVLLEAFRTNEKPAGTCSAVRHVTASLPRCLQRFPVDELGALVVPDDRVLLQLEEELPDCRFVVDPMRRLVELPWLDASGGLTTLPYRIGAEARGAAPSVEELVARNPRRLARSNLAGLGDLDVLDGRTLFVVRNDE